MRLTLAHGAAGFALLTTPQGDGGDHDGDNNGGPTDGDM
jgi:hypothetical protein